MLTYSIISIVVLAAVAAVVLVTKKGNKAKSVVVPAGVNRYEALETKAMEEAEKMTVAERADLLRRHSTDSWKGKIRDGVMVSITALSVTSLEVDGVRFESVKRAINKSASLSDNDAFRLLVLDKEMAVLRKMKFAAETNYKAESSPLFGKVYAYKASKIAIEPKSGNPARIIVKINKLADNKVEVTDIYVAASDIRNAKSYDHYDMTNTDVINRFEQLVMNNTEYKDEIEEIEVLLERIEKYNYLIQNNLLEVKGSRFVFSIPTDIQLQELINMDIDMPNTVDEEDEDDSEDLFENVHSSNE